MSFILSILGYGEDAETYAANVVAQWRVLKASFTNPPSDAWLNAHASFVKNYGNPAASEDEQRQRSIKQFKEGIDTALKDGFLDGMASVPAAVSGAIGGTAAAFWGGLPAWAKWLGIGALALLAINILTNAGILAARKTKKKNA